MIRDDQSGERARLEQAIAGLEAQRAILGDAVVDPAVAALRQQIDALEPMPEQQRKLATLLFMDIAGHTALTAHLDPEDQMAVVDTALARLAVQVERFGGRVVRFQGDGFKAAFGLPLARENDPAQAIRAGLAIQEEARAIAVELEAARGLVGFQVRVGITTGLVFAGGGTEGEDAVTGAPVSLAARLESAAEPGTVLISRDTYAHVRGFFDVQARSPVAAKGFAEPVPVFQVLRAKARPFYRLRRGVEGVETRMVGRELELRRLQKILEEVLADGERQMVTIIGEAGLGKSRLLHEFENWIGLQPEVVQLYKGRARLETQGVPFALLRDILAVRFEITDDESNTNVRRKLESGVAAVAGNREEGEQHAHIIGQLVGYHFENSVHLAGVLDDPQQLRERGAVYLGRYLRSVATQTPVLLLLEDLHWADDSSLDVLNQLVRSLADQPVMVLGVARHRLLERRPHWGEGQAFHHQIALAPLSNRDSRQLVEEVLQKLPEIPDALEEMIVTHAEGNPFYMEELVKMLVEQGVLVPEGAQWQVVEERLADIQVPSTLMGVLQARLDGLAREEKRLLQQASVVGRVFWDRTLTHIGANGNSAVQIAEIGETLAELRGRELIYRRETSAFEGAREHIFKHALLRDVTYESVLKRDRRRYHGLVAEWLLAHAGERAREVMGLIADHLDLAGEQDRARHFLRQAGQEAAAAYANEEALRYFDRALAATPEAELPGRYGLLLAREQVYDLLGQRAAQTADLEALAALATALRDPHRQAAVAIRQANYAEDIGEYEAAIEAAKLAVGLAQATGNLEQEAAAYLSWGQALWRQARFEQATPKIRLALASARAAGQPQLVANVLRQLGITEAEYTKDLEAARRYYEECLTVYRGIGDRKGECMTLNNLGVIDSRLWEIDRGTRYFEAALALARELGFRSVESLVLSNAGVMQLEQGAFYRAQTYFEQSAVIHRDVANRRIEVAVYMYRVTIALFEENYQEAKAIAEEGMALARAEHEKSAAGLSNLRGLALIGLEQWAQARGAFGQSLGISQSLENTVFVDPNEVFLYRYGMARLHLALGELAEAGLHVAWILDELRDKQNLEVRFGLLLLFVLDALLTCYKVLRTLNDPRAQSVLDTAHALAQRLAMRMPTPKKREQFLRNFPSHREIMELHGSLRARGDNR